ncbi:MAG: MFS transporter, partial [Geminicoccaceae bacterium]
MKDERLSIRALLAYGALGLPLAALNLPLYVYLPAFYAGDVGIGLAAVGWILLFARLLDTVTDPLIGEFSDRSRTRWGRRRPWVVAACPLLIIATFMLFVPGGEVGGTYLFIWTSLAYLAWTMMLLSFTAWGAELSSDYHERSRITGTREAFVVIGILLAAGLPAMLGYNAETEQGKVLRALAVSMSFLLPICLLALLWNVPERPAAPRATSLPLIAGLRLAWSNRPFLRLVGAYFLNGIANGLPATLFLLFVADGLKRGDAAAPLLLLYFVAGIIGIPVWLRISTRIGKHRTWAIAMLWAS